MNIPKVDHSIFVFRSRPLRCNTLEVDAITVVVSDGGCHLVAGSSEGAVECLLALVLRSEATQQHVVLAGNVGNHKKSTKRRLGAVHSYCMYKASNSKKITLCLQRQYWHRNLSATVPISHTVLLRSPSSAPLLHMAI